MNDFLTPEAAKRLLSDVDADEILVAARLHYPSGIHDEWIENIEELMWYLKPASDRDVPGISIEGMASWVEKSVGDATLADAIRGCEKAHDNFVDACEAAYHKVAERVSYLQQAASGGMA